MLIILGILGGFIVFVVILCVIVFSILNKQKNADYYTLGSDRIASVKSVIGVRDITSTSATAQNGVTTKSYDYRSTTSTDDILKYVTYLVDEEGFAPAVLNQNSSQPVYTKRSFEEDKILLLTMSDTGFGYTLTIQKGEGSLTVTEQE